LEPLLFAGTAAVLGLSGGLAPGPLTTLLFTQTLRHGPREGLKVALAPLITDGLFVVLAALAMEQLADLDIAFGIISLAGAAFLGWLAWDTWQVVEISVEPGAENPGSLFKAIGVNLLNPHPYLFWFTVGGPMVVKAWASGAASVSAFLGGFFFCLVGAKMAMALLIGRYRHWFRGRAYALSMRVLALMLLGFAVWTGMEGLTHFHSAPQSG
jgi:threonine/homoserine/homoserine lactone efflux protein